LTQVSGSPLSDKPTTVLGRRNVVIQGYVRRWKNLDSRRSVDCADYGIKARPDGILVHANAKNVVSFAHTHLQKQNIFRLVLRHYVSLFLSNDSKVCSNTFGNQLHQDLNLARARCVGNLLQTHRIARRPIQ
jgi:hypothetical protein